MFANAKVAIGVAHTMFWVITAEPAALWGMFGFFRPGNGVAGGTGWGFATAEGDQDGASFAGGFGGSFTGPGLQIGVPQIVISRSRKGHNSLGTEGPVVDFAVVDASMFELELEWSSRLNRAGPTAYNLPIAPDDTFTFDFRDPSVDGNHAVGAGYMMLGHFYPDANAYCQFRGVMHGFELHSTTLRSQQVLDVVRSIGNAIAPDSAPPIVACDACAAGTQDNDQRADTACEFCELGRFVDVAGATNCTGLCPTGSTIHTVGAESSETCTQCVAGQFGPIEDGESGLICARCDPGKSLATAGASSELACVQCQPGMFSASGAAACERSGCTDEAADGFDTEAIVDDGSCTYTCAHLRMRSSVTQSEGGCVIFDTDQGWHRYASNGSALTNGPQMIYDIPAGESWVIQGRPLAGSSFAQPAYTEYNGRLNCDNANMTVRYVTMTNQHGATGGLKAGAWSGGLNSWTEMSHALLADNDASYGGACTCDDKCTWDRVTISDNTGLARGGAFESGYPSLLTWRHSRFERNVALVKEGGAIYAYSGAMVVAEFTHFVANEAKLGGAIALESGCTARLTSVLFERNRATVKGGAIYLAMAVAELTTCTFEHNEAASLGAAVYMDQPASVKVVSTTFEPYVEGAITAYIGGRLAGCDEHPCAAGDSCKYERYSLECTACPELQMSTDGLSCSHCPAGQQTNLNQTGCVGCAGNTFSTSGQCLPCIGTPIDEHRQCQACPLNQVANPWEDGCRCENGYYNASAGPLLCFSRDEPFDGALTQAPLPTDPNLFCQECPSDCVDCTYTGYAGKPILNQGFATPTASAAEWFEQIPRVVFECPVDRDACLAEAPPVHNSSVIVQSSEKVCKAGYRGILCTMCTDGYSLGDVGCNECEKLTPASAVALAVLLSAVVGGIAHLSRSLKKIGGSKRLRLIIALIPELIGDFKVFIGLYQVLCSMGPTLEITCECGNVLYTRCPLC